MEDFEDERMGQTREDEEIMHFRQTMAITNRLIIHSPRESSSSRLNKRISQKLTVLSSIGKSYPV